MVPVSFPSISHRTDVGERTGPDARRTHDDGPMGRRWHVNERQSAGSDSSRNPPVPHHLRQREVLLPAYLAPPEALRGNLVSTPPAGPSDSCGLWSCVGDRHRLDDAPDRRSRRMRVFVVIDSAGRQLMERVRAQDDHFDPWQLTSAAAGIPGGWTCSRGVRDCRSRSPRCVEPLSSAYWARPTRPGVLAQTGRKVHRSVFVGRHLVVRNALLREPAAVNTRGVVGGRVGAGAGRSSVDSVDGSPLPSGADTALAGHARLTCVETWRSSGEAVGETSRTIARHSPGAAAPTARSRAGAGMPAGLDVAHGGAIARTADSCRRCRRRSV